MERPETSNRHWTTQAGDDIRIADMSRWHLENTINHIVRKLMVEDGPDLSRVTGRSRKNMHQRQYDVRRNTYEKFLAWMTADLEWRDYDMAIGLTRSTGVDRVRVFPGASVSGHKEDMEGAQVEHAPSRSRLSKSFGAK